GVGAGHRVHQMERLVRVLRLGRDAPAVVRQARAPAAVRTLRPEHGRPLELVFDHVVVGLRLTDRPRLHDLLPAGQHVPPPSSPWPGGWTWLVGEKPSLTSFQYHSNEVFTGVEPSCDFLPSGDRTQESDDAGGPATLLQLRVIWVE